MGWVLDTTVLISAERGKRTPSEMLRALANAHGDQLTVISAVSVIELTHGMYRASTSERRERRKLFADELYRDVRVQPVTFAIAQMAGQIEGEQAQLGNVLPFEDLIIGATALTLGYKVLTQNLRHFERIPNLQVLAP